MVKVKDILSVYRGNFRIFDNREGRMLFKTLVGYSSRYLDEDYAYALSKYGDMEVKELSHGNIVNGITYLKITLV